MFLGTSKYKIGRGAQTAIEYEATEKHGLVTMPSFSRQSLIGPAPGSTAAQALKTVQGLRLFFLNANLKIVLLMIPC